MNMQRKNLFTKFLLALSLSMGLIDLALAQGVPESRTSDAQREQSTRPVHIWTLPQDLEVRWAVSALPPSLRDQAGIRILSGGHYVEYRKAANPFTCIVSRRAGNLYPVCFDEEGTRTILPAYEDDATMRQNGMTSDKVEAELANGFASGRYQPPSRPGIAYMLSPATFVLGSDGTLHSVPAHVMFYAPYLTDKDIGGAMGKTAFVDRPGPHGMIIVLAGQAERDRALTEQQSLLNEIKRTIHMPN